MEDQCNPISGAVNAPAWMTVKEFAEATRVAQSSVYRHVSEGRIKHSRVGGAIRIPRSALEAFERGESMA